MVKSIAVITACLLTCVPAGLLAQTAPVPSRSTPLRDSLPAAVAASAAQDWGSYSPVHWSPAKKGLIVGAVAGGVTGIVLGAYLCDGWECGRRAAGLGALFAAAGAGIGAGIGTLIEGGYVSPERRPRVLTPPVSSPLRRLSFSWRF